MFSYLLAGGILLIPLAASAQPDYQTGEWHSGHDTMAGDTATLPTEPGQGAFAAIQEIVDILVADPNTDWSAVDIDALRRHLVDMSNVTLHAKVDAVPTDNGYRYEVTGNGEVRASIRRMVAAHAATMQGSRGWSYQSENRPEGAAMTVTVADRADLAKLRGLGFFGILALGMHHQAHHLMIAKGHLAYH